MVEAAAQCYCRKCQEYKPATEFYVSNKTQCKECIRRAVRANRERKKDYYRQKDRERANSPHRVQARKEYAQSERGKVAGGRAKRRYTERNPDKRAAHIAVGNAIRDGHLKKEPCFFCGAENVHGHHVDYDQPLEVIWLCVRCHQLIHDYEDKVNEILSKKQEKAA